MQLIDDDSGVHVIDTSSAKFADSVVCVSEVIPSAASDNDSDVSPTVKFIDKAILITIGRKNYLKNQAAFLVAVFWVQASISMCQEKC